MLRVFKCSFILLSVVLGGAPLLSAQTIFHISLSGDQEVPPVETEATGQCIGVLNEEETEFTVTCTHDVVDVNGAHIHMAAVGVNGDIVFPFADPTSPFRGTWELSPDDVEDLFAGDLYVNVHSEVNPGGEIRGQINNASISAVEFPLEEGQEVPPTGSDATGSCVAVLNPARTTLTVTCEHDVEALTGAHIHNAPVGVNGPIVFPFSDPTSPIIETWNLGAQFVDELFAGDLYVNVHSEVNPGGDIRGQIPPPPAAIHFAQFGDGTQMGVTLGSDVVVTNPSETQVVTGTVFFLDAEGSPLEVSFTSSADGMEQVGSQADFVLEPLGSITISTNQAGDLLQGSSTVITDGLVGGVIRFNIVGSGIAGVGSQTPSMAALVPVRRNADINTGIAVRNTEDRPIEVTLTLRDESGMAVADGMSLTLLAFQGRESMFINELFPDADTEDFRGTVEIRSADGSFVAIALELGGDPGEFTTLPVTPIAP